MEASKQSIRVSRELLNFPQKSVCYDGVRFRPMRAIFTTCLYLVGILSGAQSWELGGIAHVAFRVTSLDRTRQFYEKLGFEQAFEFRDEQHEPVQLFIKINDRQFIELYRRTQDSQALGVMHVCYEASDIESVRIAYVKAGLNVPEVKRAKAGNLLFVLHDPEGQVVEYTQYLPASLHWQDRGKHLGPNRIADYLKRATLSVKDVDAEFAFYSEKLGFARARAGSDNALEISNDELTFEPAAGNTAGQVAFGVRSEKKAYLALEKGGLAPKMINGVVQVSDPDGNVITFLEGGQDIKR